MPAGAPLFMGHEERFDVNYFEFYPGDYLRDTTRLTLAEHGAYLRLMLAYYSDEQPLPAEKDELFRIVCAQNSAEKQAVLKVANLFFPVTRDGNRHNARADQEIAKCGTRMDAKGDRKSTEAERQQRYRDRRADMFTALSRVGIVPAYNISTDELTKLVTQNVTSQTVTNVTPSRPSHTATRPQTPDPTIQKQDQELFSETSQPPLRHRFDDFWAVYPVKKGKSSAEAKWKARKLDAIADLIIADVQKRLTQDQDWVDGYIPHGSTYVNGKGWEDGMKPLRIQPASTAQAEAPKPRQYFTAPKLDGSDPGTVNGKPADKTKTDQIIRDLGRKLRIPS
jgi:uncharacterized protein YdaU (DUF1376 family)